LPDKIKSAGTAAAAKPEFVGAFAANPGDAQLLRGMQASGGSATLDDTSFINRLNDVVAHPFKVGFSDAMSSVFLIAVAIMVIGFLAAFLLPELPLRHHSAAQQRFDEDVANAAATPAANGKPAVNGEPAASWGRDRRASRQPAVNGVPAASRP
jgi:hypothetical protein